MTMKCPNCGNDLNPEEVFCGQCGTPNLPVAKPTEMVNTPPARHGLLSGGYHPAAPGTGTLPQPDTQPATRSPGPQQGGFYQNPTEAISALPGQGQHYPAGYPQQGPAGTPMPGGYPYGSPAQPFQAGNYSGTLYPPIQQAFPTGQGYGMPPGFTPPPQKQGSNIALIIACVCVALAVITVGAFGAVYLLHNTSSGKTHTTSHPKASPTSVATATPIPSPSPTLIPSPSPTVTATSTPAPDAGFAWCDVTCTSNGFSVEYPGTWQQKPTSDSTGTQFTNSSAPDEFAAFKTPGATTNNADQLVSSDLMNNFSSQPGYTTPTPTSTTFSNTTIGGENWSYQTAYYQFNGQTERIEVYATVHGGKAYIIELQAPDAQFHGANTQYFEPMLGRFQFQ